MNFWHFANLKKKILQFIYVSTQKAPYVAPYMYKKIMD